MEKIFEMRVEKRDDRVIFELWRNDQEEPIAKREVMMRDVGDYFNVVQALYQTLRELEQEFTRWAQQQLFKK